MRKLCCLALLSGLFALGMVLATSRPANAYPPPAGGLFFAFLSGDEEVPAVETDAFGLAVYRALPSGDAMIFALLTFGLEDTVQAHIHVAPEGVNGPVVAFLFGPASPPVTQDGLLAFGVITADDLVGPLSGQPLSALIDEMEDGNTYTNAHTVAHPGGEIRGQNGEAFNIPAPPTGPASD